MRASDTFATRIMFGEKGGGEWDDAYLGYIR